VKFNERCFVRLLGDMRSYNFVVDITPDIEDVQYRIRAIDFDQQSYEGRRRLYLPQFFKENKPLVELSGRLLNADSIKQYQAEERTMIAFRMASTRRRILDLLSIMSRDLISRPEKMLQLKTELGEFFNSSSFRRCQSMGQIVKTNLKETLRKHFALIQKSLGRSGD
jgi:hypothetical protein